MDAVLFAKLLSDPSITDLKKLHYKYPQADMAEFVSLLKASVYTTLSLPDFKGAELVYLENVTHVRMKSLKALMLPQGGSPFGLRAMEEEITSTLEIEGIDTSRDSVRRILQGYAPYGEGEQQIYGMKRGLDFISDSANTITEENIYILYQMAIGDYLEPEDRLLPGRFYRHDAVYVVNQKVEHTGLPHEMLSTYMGKLVKFIRYEQDMNDLLKAAVIHFYLAYCHPYFDGNGRMARLLHLWYLVQSGYPSTLFVPISALVSRSSHEYYKAYTLVEDNAKVSGVVDVTPFLTYFISQVYDKLEQVTPPYDTQDAFQGYLQSGQVTEKEKALWNFVLSAYGTDDFSTKQLEKDYGDAAYATIRSFVLKFKTFGLLKGQRYGNRVRYSVQT